MNPALFSRFKDLIYEKSGIHLSENKETLLSVRLGKRMRELGIHDYHKYLECLVQDETGEEVINMLDFISTNVTIFYRESRHFEVFDNLMK